jgi:hypothetical protein
VSAADGSPDVSDDQGVRQRRRLNTVPPSPSLSLTTPAKPHEPPSLFLPPPASANPRLPLPSWPARRRPGGRRCVRRRSWKESTLCACKSSAKKKVSKIFCKRA